MSNDFALYRAFVCCVEDKQKEINERLLSTDGIELIKHYQYFEEGEHGERNNHYCLAIQKDNEDCFKVMNEFFSGFGKSYSEIDMQEDVLDEGFNTMRDYIKFLGSDWKLNMITDNSEKFMNERM